jgi:hypothetical protein
MAWMRLGCCAVACLVGLLGCGSHSEPRTDVGAASTASSASLVVPASLTSVVPVASASASQAKPVKPPPPFSPHGAPGHFARTIDASEFQRGNLHTHTRESDGDTKPAEVARWYRDHGYQFLAITDHDKRVDSKAVHRMDTPGFVLIPGEEITMAAGGRSVHVNAFCHEHAIRGARFGSPRRALAWAVKQVRAQDGIALVNHPNFDWALREGDLVAAKGAELLEIWSGHPWVHTNGDRTHLSHEAIWDATLGMGLDFTGVAVDDVHHFAKSAPKPPARPGKGWVEVATPTLSVASICDALRRGDLYASSGASIERFVVKDAAMAVTPHEAEAKVEFVGQSGALLATVATSADEPTATYTLQGGETYVRARVTRPDGTKAWTPAYRVVE